MSHLPCICNALLTFSRRALSSDSSLSGSGTTNRFSVILPVPIDIAMSRADAFAVSTSTGPSNLPRLRQQRQRLDLTGQEGRAFYHLPSVSHPEFTGCMSRRLKSRNVVGN